MDSLPLDVHIEIAHYLPLRDALSYSQVSKVTFDAVYYVFAHREELDFSSLLDANNTISLSDAAILAILHAHTRVSVISNFCLTRTFTLFSDLDHYLSLYWRKYTNIDSTVVGHPMGKLQRIAYLNCHGLPYDAATENIDLIIGIWQKYEPYSEFLSYIDSSCIPCKPWLNIPLYYNWSTANIEIPYHCFTCNSLIPYESDECDQCSSHFIH